MVFDPLSFHVGVVIPTYNAEKYLRGSVESVLGQRLPPQHIVICDDCSTDGTRDIIAEYEKSYPSLIEGLCHPKRLGMSANFNSGLRRIKGDYVSLISGDDVWHANKLYLEAEAISCSDVGYAFSKVAKIVDGEVIEKKYEVSVPNRVPFDFSLYILLREIYPRNALISKDVIEKIGYFDTSGIYYSDWDLSIRYSVKYQGVFVPEYTVYRRIHNESATFKIESGSSNNKYIEEIFEVIMKNKNSINSFSDSDMDILSDYYYRVVGGVDSFFRVIIINLRIFFMYCSVFGRFSSLSRKVRLFLRVVGF